jgi:hypothetical protein
MNPTRAVLVGKRKLGLGNKSEARFAVPPLERAGI